MLNQISAVFLSIHLISTRADDIFAVFENRKEAENFIRVANVQDPNIKLSDTNIGRSVHFLDLQISINERGGFETSLYRKESDLVVLLHHRSAHTSGIKDGVIVSQLRRYLLLHTNYTEAGRCMYVFMHLMIQLRDLSPRRARFVWSVFVKKIRNGAIPLGRQTTTTTGGNGKVGTSHRKRFSGTIRIPTPQTVRWKRIRTVLDEFFDQLNGPQRLALRNIQLFNTISPPLGVM